MEVAASSCALLAKPSTLPEISASAHSEPAGLAQCVSTAPSAEPTTPTLSSANVLPAQDGTGTPALELSPAGEAENGTSTLSLASARPAQCGTALSV